MRGANAGVNTSSIFDMSDIENVLKNMYIGSDIIDYILGVINNIYNVVNRSGVPIILFLAGLQSISPSVYEAAYIEGASNWEVFWKITLPMISPVVLVNCIYTAIDGFTNSTNPIMLMVTDYLRPGFGHGTVSAISWIYFVMICAFLAIIALLGRKLVFQQEKV